MFCLDCKHDLGEVPLDDPCPQCGGLRRSAQVSAEAALVVAMAMSGNVTIGYNMTPGWTYQWRSIQKKPYASARPV